MLTAVGLMRAYGARTLFEGIDLKLNPGNRVGLVGPNGAGKSTLLKTLAGIEPPDSGDVFTNPGVEVAYLEQEVEVNAHEVLHGFVRQGARRLLEMSDRLEALRVEMSNIAESEAPRLEALTLAYAELQERFERRGGYEVDSLVREVLAGMGFGRADHDRTLGEFSGGWRVRALLSRLLVGRPEILLLDEPTNHLDVEALAWLERFLARYEGAVMIISHDRAFLNAVVSHIGALEHGSLMMRHGGYDDYIRQREMEREQQRRLQVHQRREREKIEGFVERFRYKATKSAQVQSRVKQLEKLQEIEVDAQVGATYKLRFQTSERLPETLVSLDGISKSYGEKVVFEDVRWSLLRGEKVAIVGPNGAGKTTLLKILAGKERAQEGSMMWNPKVRVAYFAQHALEELTPGRTVLEELGARCPKHSQTELRTMLGVLGFSGDEVHKPVEVLSGGEKSKVNLSAILLLPFEVLLLDEPTNHLDLYAREALEGAIREFEGAVLMVSHDRYLLEQTTNQVMEVKGGRVEVMGKGYKEWKETLHNTSLYLPDPQHTPDSASPSLPTSMGRKERRQALANLREKFRREHGALEKKVRAVEERVSELEEEIAGIDGELQDPSVYEDPQKSRGLFERRTKTQRACDEAYERWEILQLEYEEAKGVFDLEVSRIEEGT